MAGDTTRVARPGRGPARSPPGWPSSTCCGSRSRWPARTCAGSPALRAAGARDPHRRRRDDPDVRRDAGRPRCRRVRRLPARRGPRRRDAPGADRRASWRSPATAGSRRTPGRTGSGLLANLHVAAGVGGGPFIEFPYDPPGWTPERRDAFLAEPIRPDADGVLRVPARPGWAPSSTRPRSRGTRHEPRARPRPSPTGWRAPPRSRPRTELFIDGRFVPAASGRTFDDIAGRDGSRHRRGRRGRRRRTSTGRSPPRGASFDDRRWADQSPADRKRVLLRLAELIRANRDELALLESLDVGKPIRDTLAVDVPSAPRPSSGTPRRSTRSTARSARPGPTRCRS